MENSGFSGLQTPLGKLGLGLSKVGRPCESPDGMGQEQCWSCFDEKGELFKFTTIVIKEGNPLGLKAGTIFIWALGPEKNSPRKRKESWGAADTLGRVVLSLGGEVFKRRQKSSFQVS